MDARVYAHSVWPPRGPHHRRQGEVPEEVLQVCSSPSVYAPDREDPEPERED